MAAVHRGRRSAVTFIRQHKYEIHSLLEPEVSMGSNNSASPGRQFQLTSLTLSQFDLIRIGILHGLGNDCVPTDIVVSFLGVCVVFTYTRSLVSSIRVRPGVGLEPTGYGQPVKPDYSQAPRAAQRGAFTIMRCCDYLSRACH